MRKKYMYFLTIIISAFIPIYFFFLWEPLKSSEVMNQSLMENKIVEKDVKVYKIENDNLINGVFKDIEGLNLDKREKLNSLINELSIVDIIKINQYFSNLDNKEDINSGFSLLNKRMSTEKYQEFRGIIKDYINLEE